MRPAEVMVRGVLLCILLLFVWAIGSVLSDSGEPAYLILLLCLAFLFAGLAAGGMMKMTPATPAKLCLGASIALFVIASMLHFHVISFCGDGMCSNGECGWCNECGLAQCQDGTCEPPMESCSNARDCSCLDDDVCAPQRNQSDEQGCFQRSCGDGFCDPGESGNCCSDCKCADGFYCMSNTCYFRPPSVSADIFIINDTISALSLYADRTFLDSQGIKRPFAAIYLQSTGMLKDANMTFTVPGLINQTVPMGTVEKGWSPQVLWYPSAERRLLAVNHDVKRNMTITLRYLDAQDVARKNTWIVPITILEVHTMDRYGDVVLFATRDVTTTASTPEGIWDELHANVNATGRSERIQFPHETIAAGQGSPRDVAILLASVYDAAGLRPSFVVPSEISREGELYVRVKTDDGYVTLDPAKLNGDFDDARVRVPGMIYDIRQVRLDRNITIATFR